MTYYFVPDGTPDLPFLTPFYPSVWDPDPKGGRMLGDVYGAAKPYHDGSKVGDALGTGPACGTPEQWRDGLAFPPATPVPVSPAGTNLCCARAAQQAPAVTGIKLWWRPEELAYYQEGDTLSFWNPAAPTTNQGIMGGNGTTRVHYDPATGRPGAFMHSVPGTPSIITASSLPLPGDFTTFIAGRSGATTTTRRGPNLSGQIAGCQLPSISRTTFFVGDLSGNLTAPETLPPGQLEIWSVVSTGGIVQLLRDGVLLASGPLTTGAWQIDNLAIMRSPTISQDGTTWIPEVMAWDRALTADEQRQTLAYLQARYPI